MYVSLRDFSYAKNTRKSFNLNLTIYKGCKNKKITPSIQSIELALYSRECLQEEEEEEDKLLISN